ncbi:putative UPF0481 protein At3g02645 [Coffea arabica]|uniref:UPF0481 protein At3g02645 n=1 Tax=Coffea arabica TaxID=13443 RepID=A0A6P6WTQ3_COFAR
MSSSFFGSTTSEQRLANQFNEHFTIYIENDASIFRVPKKVCDTKPETYAPQQIGLGAYHHLGPDLDEMNRRKLEAVKIFLKPEQYRNFKSLIVDKVKELEPSVRACYSKYLDIDGDTLAWIMSIDGVYLLHRLSTYRYKGSVDSEDRKFAQDIAMLENQMPVIVLEEILKAIQAPVEGEVQGADDDDEAGILGDTSNPHLLSYMYNLIVKNWSLGDQSPKVRILLGSARLGSALVEGAGKATQAASVAADLTGQKPLQLLASLPLQQLAALFKEDSEKGNSSIEEIHIPSASQLDASSKVQFEVWREDSGVKIMELENRVMCLPVITLNTDSEVILRNLVAYEVASASPGSTFILGGYVDFICGIIDTAKDVDLLKEKGIIESNLLSEEIAEIFNGISKCSSQRALPQLEEATQELNRIYDSTFTVRTWRFIRDNLIPSVKLLFAILVLLLLTLQSVCQVYGCSARWLGRISSI